jgi:hypothetical protein
LGAWSATFRKSVSPALARVKWPKKNYSWCTWSIEDQQDFFFFEFILENGGNTLLRNFGHHSPNYAASPPRKHILSESYL